MLDAAECDATQAVRPVPAQHVVNAADDCCAPDTAKKGVDYAVMASTTVLASTAALDVCGFAAVVLSAKSKTALENKVSCISFGCMTEY